ncbi:VOC family protein [Mucilaginibacter aquaedulcis]|uniref:VOC family protein n=1 Tax=Mucilaginibacter aquaedulcis TaxID=1187081 RepID=UPI0025B5D9BD|nr:VOC family protein [Mucilaginibacter aquaedulcis]MDN3548262.1 VOC family protein [Mucilaginibacter aquaedulcis]
MIESNKAFSGFSVNDLQKAKEFYGEILGLNIYEDKHMPQLLNLEITKDNIILIYPKPNHVPATFTILNFPVNSVEQTVDELTQRGVKFIVYNQPEFKTDERGILKSGDDDPTIAWFNDPAGNILSIIEQHDE